MIDPQEVVELVKALVAMPSVTGDEGPVGDLLERRLAEAGLETELQAVEGARRNVVARLRGGDGPTLLLAGHMDVVPSGSGWKTDPFVPRVEGDRLYGRGSCDMKGGLAAAVVAIATAARVGVKPPGDVVFAAFVGEEEDLAGVQAAVERGLRADMAIVAEPTEMELVRAHKGAVVFELAVRGKAAHASTPESGLNAIVAAADLIGALAEMGRRVRAAEHPLLGAGSLTVGTIHGGTRPYIVPAECVIELDRRILPGETGASVRAGIEPLLTSLEGRFGVTTELREVIEALPLETARDHAVVALLEAAAAKHGPAPRVVAWPAVSDASVLANQGGVPTVLFGPGSIVTDAHQANESVSIEQCVTAARIFLDAMMLQRAGVIGRPARGAGASSVR